MARFLVEYTHVEEIKYTQWVEAETEEAAVAAIEDYDADFSEVVDSQGLEIKNVHVLDTEDEEDEDDE